MKLTLIRGIPGSGKTTKALELAEDNDEIIEADMFFEVLNEDGTDVDYKFDFEFLGAAHKWCQSMAEYMLFGGENVIISNTSIHYKDINTYYKIALKYGAEFEIINCIGNYKNTHNVPEEVIKRMKERFKPISTEEWLEHVAEMEERKI